jgi:hypothetical protein
MGRSEQLMEFADLVGRTEPDKAKLRKYLGQKSAARPVAGGNGN